MFLRQSAGRGGARNDDEGGGGGRVNRGGGPRRKKLGVEEDIQRVGSFWGLDSNDADIPRGEYLRR